MTEASKIAIVQIASSILSAAFTSGSLLYPLLASLLVKLSLKHGNISISAGNYACYSLILCNISQNIDLAEQFGRLAWNLASKFDDKAVKPEVFFLVSCFILHRKSHIKETLPLLREGYTLGLEVGNPEFAGYNGQNFCRNSFWCGQPLGNLEQDTRTYYNALVQLNQLGTANYCLIHWQVTLNLLDLEQDPTILTGLAFQETEFLPLLQSTNDLYGLYVFYSYKLTLCFLFGEIESANSYALECRNYFMGGMGTIGEPAFYLYDSLIALAQLNQQSDRALEVLERVAENQTRLQHWGHHAPMNYQHKFDLVEAEKLRVLGKNYEAGDWYDRAISGAKENGYVQEEALANELAAKFYLGWGKEKIAAGYMQEAHYGYARWDAKAKTNDLEQRYPHLLISILQNRPYIAASGNSTMLLNQSLDITSVFRAAQAISEEIVLENLLTKLMQVILATAGATKGILLLPNNNQMSLVAMIAHDSDQAVLLPFLPMELSQELPLTIVNAVRHHREPLILDDPQATGPFVVDPYWQHHPIRAALCMPLLKQGRLIGILYLENQLTAGAFTRDRIEILTLLCTQAAISLENAQLYQQSQQSLEALRSSEVRFQTISDNLPGVIVQICINPDDGSSFTSYISSGCHDLYEVTAEAIILGQYCLRDFEHPDDRSRIAQAIRQSAENLVPFRQEFRIMTLSGKVKWVQVASQPKRQANGWVIWDGVLMEISDRKQAEFALRDSEERFRATFEQAAVGILEMDTHGNIVRMNQKFCDIVGYSEAALSFKHISGITHPDDLANNKAHVIRLLAGETSSFAMEKRYIHANGSIVWVNLFASLVRDVSGEPEYFIGVVQDITDRKRSEAERDQAEQALRFSESQYHMLAQIAPVGIFRTNLQGDCIYANERWCQIAGFTMKAALGQGWSSAIHPDDRERVFAEWYQAAQSNRRFQTECRFQHAVTGQIAWVLAQAIAEHDPEGTIIGYVGTVTDITDRKAAEAALTESENKFRRLVEGANDMIWAAQADSTLTYLSPQFQTMFGLSPSEWIGQSFAKLIHPDDLDRAIAPARVSLERGEKQQNVEFRHLCRDGSYLWVTVNMTPIKDAEGNAIGLQGIVRDISDRKAAEVQLQQQAHQLEVANQQLANYSQTLEHRVEERTVELKTAQERIIAQEKLASLGTLTAGIAHELRNPLNFVKNYAEGSIELTQDLLDALQPITPAQDPETAALIAILISDLQENAATICHHSQRASHIIASMMQHARTDDGRTNPQPILLHDLLNQAAQLSYRSKRAQDDTFHLTIYTHYDAAVTVVNVIPSALTRAFINLIDNACDAMRMKQHQLATATAQTTADYTPTLVISTQQAGEQVEIRIHDNGCGIPPLIQAKIFDPFFTTKPPGAGTGLGLSITHDIIVQQHQGTLAIHSNFSEFTEVIVVLTTTKIHNPIAI